VISITSLKNNYLHEPTLLDFLLDDDDDADDMWFLELECRVLFEISSV